MTRAPDWTEAEFVTVLDCPTCYDEELSRRLGRRTPGAVGVVRAGLHHFHTAGDSPLLSELMRRVLERRGATVCPACRAQF